MARAKLSLAERKRRKAERLRKWRAKVRDNSAQHDRYLRKDRERKYNRRRAELTPDRLRKNSKAKKHMREVRARAICAGFPVRAAILAQAIARKRDRVVFPQLPLRNTARASVARRSGARPAPSRRHPHKKLHLSRKYTPAQLRTRLRKARARVTRKKQNEIVSQTFVDAVRASTKSQRAALPPAISPLSTTELSTTSVTSQSSSLPSLTDTLDTSCSQWNSQHVAALYSAPPSSQRTPELSPCSSQCIECDMHSDSASLDEYESVDSAQELLIIPEDAARLTQYADN